MDGLAPPHRHLAHGAKPAQKQYAAIARAIAEFTPVTMCANQADYANCKAAFEEDENVTVIEMTTDDAGSATPLPLLLSMARAISAPTTGTSIAYGGLVDGLYFRGTRTSRLPLRWLSFRLPSLSSR
ncbi:MAG: agmatine deiminase family protein [Collinsella sp.]